MVQRCTQRPKNISPNSGTFIADNVNGFLTHSVSVARESIFACVTGFICANFQRGQLGRIFVDAASMNTAIQFVSNISRILGFYRILSSSLIFSFIPSFCSRIPFLFIHTLFMLMLSRFDCGAKKIRSIIGNYSCYLKIFKKSDL